MTTHRMSRLPSLQDQGDDVESIRVLGIRVDRVTTQQVLARIESAIRGGRSEAILNVNVHACNIAISDPTFAEMLERSPMVFCDGAGVRLGARILGKDIPEVITYDDFIWSLAELCQERGYRLFLLGGYPGDADSAARALLARFPKTNLAVHHGFFEKTGPANDEVIAKVNAFGPHVIVCSLGMPIQEKWISANMSKISANIFLAGGGCVDLLAGRAPRPPAWMVRSGMRWLFRFTYEPRRVFRRYILGNPLFMARVLLQRLGLRFL